MNKIMYFKNSVSSLALLSTNIFFSIFFVAYFVREFGLSDFSSLSILLQISAAMILVNSPLNISLARLIISDEKNTPIYFQVVFIFTTFMFLGIFVITALVSLYNDVDYFVLLLFLVGTYLFCLTLNENVYLFKQGVLYVQNTLQIFNVYLRVFLFFIFNLFLEPIISFALSFFFINLLQYFLMRNFYCRCLPRKLKTDIFKPDLSILNLIIKNSKYLFLNSFGSILIRNLDLMVIVWLLSSTDSGEYSLYLQIIALLRLFTEAISSSVAPKIMSGFIQDFDGIQSSFYLFLKIIYYIVAIASMYILINIDFIWKLWIGDSIPFNFDIIAILIISSCITGGFYAFSYVQNSLNKNKVPALASLAFGILYIGLGVFVLHSGFGLFFYALIYTLLIVSKNLIFSAYYNSYILNSSFKGNLMVSLNSLFPAVIPASLLLYLYYYLEMGIVSYILIQMFVLVLSSIVFFKYSLSNEERVYLINILRK